MVCQLVAASCVQKERESKVSIQWYYSHGFPNLEGPYTGEQIEQFVQTGRVHPDDFLWHQGLKKWTKLQELNEFKINSNSKKPERGFRVPPKIYTWLTATGIFKILFGSLMSLTVLGAILGIPLIISGVALLKARSNLNPPVQITPFLQGMETAVRAQGFVYILATILLLAGPVITFLLMKNFFL